MAIDDDFLYPRSRYYGDFTPENLLFNANLQEFTQKVSLICGLETGGKISAEEAYYQIKHLWKELKKSKKNLGIGEDSDHG
ncbi:MAG: hypothetical protein AB4080_01865 [Trichodesmium sp.]